jgi:hypothetical protein
VPDHREAIGRPGLAPRIVERQPFIKGQRVTFAGRAGDEYAANAIVREERCQNGNRIGRNLSVGAER